jgi:hypothetical protein
MVLVFPIWVKWTLRVVGWAAWQVFVLFCALVLFANLFSEYGVYSNRFVDPVAAVAFFVAAIWFGTWLPVRRWRASQYRSNDHDSTLSDRNGGP